ncbi:hypothetical protein X975_12526, partial [Stegodyphus mimosarum]
MALIKPVKMQSAPQQKVFVHKDLDSCIQVFIRVDRIKKPLEPAYEGPFPVLDRQEKYFSLSIKGKPVKISVDRLKPAYTLNTETVPADSNLSIADNKPSVIKPTSESKEAR